MSETTDERFQELAMKLVRFECSAEEKAELKSIIEQYPTRREELRTLGIRVGIARELLPMVEALGATEGTLSKAEQDTLAVARARRREQRRARNSDSGSSAGGSGSANRGRQAVIDVEPEKPAGDGFFDLSRLSQKHRFYWLIAFCALVAFLGVMLIKPGSQVRWNFAFIQPMLSRSGEQTEPLSRFIMDEFPNASIIVTSKGSQELKEWETSWTPPMVQVKCNLEGLRLHPSWLVASFEVQGKLSNGASFQRTVPVIDGDWTNALLRVRQLVQEH